VKRRTQAIDRRKPPDTVTLGDLTVDFNRHKAYVKREERYLTRIEWLLLGELARNAGRLMPYEELLTRVWGPEYRDDIQTLRTWISRLRSKLDSRTARTQLIRTIPKVGYIMDVPPVVD
jgi:two-component system KDP operon response regulator KdpE